MNSIIYSVLYPKVSHKELRATCRKKVFNEFLRNDGPMNGMVLMGQDSNPDYLFGLNQDSCSGIIANVTRYILDHECMKSFGAPVPYPYPPTPTRSQIGTIDRQMPTPTCLAQ